MAGSCHPREGCGIPHPRNTCWPRRNNQREARQWRHAHPEGHRDQPRRTRMAAPGEDAQRRRRAPPPARRAELVQMKCAVLVGAAVPLGLLVAPAADACSRMTVEARSTQHPALAAGRALEPHATVPADTRIAVPPHGWLRLHSRGVAYRLRASHAVVRCRVLDLERGSLTVLVVHPRPQPVLATPEASLAAARAGTRAVVTVGVRTRARVRNGVLRVTAQ